MQFFPSSVNVFCYSCPSAREKSGITNGTSFDTFWWLLKRAITLISVCVYESGFGSFDGLTPSLVILRLLNYLCHYRILPNLHPKHIFYHFSWLSSSSLFCSLVGSDSTHSLHPNVNQFFGYTFTTPPKCPLLRTEITCIANVSHLLNIYCFILLLFIIDKLFRYFFAAALSFSWSIMPAIKPIYRHKIIIITNACRLNTMRRVVSHTMMIMKVMLTPRRKLRYAHVYTRSYYKSL